MTPSDLSRGCGAKWVKRFEKLHRCEIKYIYIYFDDCERVGVVGMGDKRITGDIL